MRSADGSLEGAGAFGFAGASSSPGNETRKTGARSALARRTLANSSFRSFANPPWILWTISDAGAWVSETNWLSDPPTVALSVAIGPSDAGREPLTSAGGLACSDCSTPCSMPFSVPDGFSFLSLCLSLSRRGIGARSDSRSLSA